MNTNGNERALDGRASMDIEVDAEPFAGMSYLNAVANGRSESTMLGFYRGRASWIPDELEGIVVTADLQGIVPHPLTKEPELMGLAVVDQLVDLYLDGLIPSPARMAALLAGDFFALADTRGGFGCVAEVWQVFASRFAQVIGVAGNHDVVRQVSRGQGTLLDGNWVTMGPLCVGGTGLIMGHPSKPGRRADADQLDRIEAVAEARPDVLILHEGPPGGVGQPGQPLIEEIVRRHRVPLTICGHKHWSNPICRNEHGVILNAHERVIVLVR